MFLAHFFTVRIHFQISWVCLFLLYSHYYTLIQGPIISCLDHYNCFPSVLSLSLLYKPSHPTHVSPNRLIKCKSGGVTLLLQWLFITFRIKFKILNIVYKALCDPALPTFPSLRERTTACILGLQICPNWSYFNYLNTPRFFPHWGFHTCCFLWSKYSSPLSQTNKLLLGLSAFVRTMLLETFLDFSKAYWFPSTIHSLSVFTVPD